MTSKKNNNSIKSVANTNANIIAEYQAAIEAEREIGRSERTPVEYREVTVAGIVCHVRAKSLDINVGANGDAFQIHGESQTEGVMSALTEMHVQPASHKYSNIEYGLVLFAHGMNAPQSRFCGWVTRQYAGGDKDLQALRPEKGVVILGHRMGEFHAMKHIESIKDESLSEREREIFWKAEGFDLILSGRKLHIAPFLKVNKKDEDGRWIARENGNGFEREYSEKRVIGMISAYTSKWFMDPEVALGEREASFLAADTRKDDYRFAKVTRQVLVEKPELKQALEVSGFLTIVEADGNRVPVAVKDLVAQAADLKRVVGSMRIGVVRVTAQNAAVLVANCLRGAEYAFEQ